MKSNDFDPISISPEPDTITAIEISPNLNLTKESEAEITVATDSKPCAAEGGRGPLFTSVPPLNPPRSDPTNRHSTSTVATSSTSSGFPLRLKRNQPLPEIAAFCDGLIRLEYKTTKYTCFYCVVGTAVYL